MVLLMVVEYMFSLLTVVLVVSVVAAVPVAALLCVDVAGFYS